MQAAASYQLYSIEHNNIIILVHGSLSHYNNIALEIVRVTVISTKLSEDPRRRVVDLSATKYRASRV